MERVPFLRPPLAQVSYPETLEKAWAQHLAPRAPDAPRALSIGEAKRIGAFPDPYLVTGTYEQQWASIGNSVPPLFMRAIAAHVRELIDG